MGMYVYMQYNLNMPYKDPEKRRQAAKKHYLSKKAAYAQQAQLRRMRILNWVNELKELSGCSDCKGNFPTYVLEFDDPKNTVIRAINSGSWGMTKSATTGKTVVCANCMRIRKHNQQVISG